MATTQDKDEKESPKKKGGKDLDDLKKEVPIVSTLLPASCDLSVMRHIILVSFHLLGVPDRWHTRTQKPQKIEFKIKASLTKALKSQLSSEEFIDSVLASLQHSKSCDPTVI